MLCQLSYEVKSVRVCGISELRLAPSILDFPKSFLWRASLPLWKGLLSLAARQISPVEKSTGDVIVYIEGRSQCFHNRLFKNPFTISKIPFFPQNFLANQTVGKIKKIQANLSQTYHRPYEKSSIITLPENLGMLSRVPSMKVYAPHISVYVHQGA